MAVIIQEGVLKSSLELKEEVPLSRNLPRDFGHLFDDVVGLEWRIFLCLPSLPR